MLFTGAHIHILQAVASLVSSLRRVFMVPLHGVGVGGSFPGVGGAGSGQSSQHSQSNWSFWAGLR